MYNKIKPSRTYAKIGFHFMIGFLIITGTTCTRSLQHGPESLETEVPDPKPALMATYTNAYYKFEFKYPAGIVITEEEKGLFRVLVYAEPESPFQIRATENYSENEPLYFLDTESTGIQTLGEITWQVFTLPDGYQDATGVSPPIYALQSELGSILYSIVIYDQEGLTDLQSSILSTFKVLE